MENIDDSLQEGNTKEQPVFNHGEKMLKLTVKFFTNNIPGGDLKTTWGCGAIGLLANPKRGIKPDLIHFQNPFQIQEKLIELLQRNGIISVRKTTTIEPYWKRE